MKNSNSCLLLMPYLLLFSCFMNAQNYNPIVSGNNAFALQLYSNLKEDKNMFYSPFSISTALAMVYDGARNETKQQMSRTLNFSPLADSFNIQYKELIETTGNDTVGGNKLTIANSLWGQENYRFNVYFTHNAMLNFKSEVKNIDFIKKDGLNRCEGQINRWVKEKTNGKITDVVKDLSTSTRLLLINAIYFKGKWETQFPVADTKKDVFYLNKDSTKRGDFMHLKSTAFNYYEDDLCKSVELPYMGEKLSMLIVLPQKVEDIQKLDKSFSYPYYLNLVNHLTKEKVVLTIPKFKLETGYELSKTLTAMGMSDAFTAQADFSGMKNEEEKEKLYINSIIHKAYVDVSEEGTEAAAATVVHIRMMSMLSKKEVIKQFKADHPFIFIIRDNASGSILFIGKLMTP